MTAFCAFFTSLLLCVTFAQIDGFDKSDVKVHKWVAVVHKKYDEDQFKRACGGVLVSEEFVLSVAHCFRNLEKVLPTEDFRVTVGDIQRPYSVSFDESKRGIKELILQDLYRGQEASYAHDIAIIRLAEKVSISNTIEPVSIDWSTSFKDEQLKGLSGTIAGWAFTETNEPSSVKIAVTLPFVDHDTCLKTVPEKFQQFVTSDKFCVGLRNGSNVCPGDSGAGLVFQNAADKKWFVRGIMSVGINPHRTTDFCWKWQYVAFTSINKHQEWLREKMLTRSA